MTLLAFLGLAVGCGDANRQEFRSFNETLLMTAEGDPDLSTFVELVKLAELETPFDTTATTLTVFAPTNAAFSALPAATLSALREDTDALGTVLLYHATGGSIPRSLLMTADELKTTTGTTVAVRTSGESITLKNSVASASFVRGDTYASNGILHVIDGVLVPPLFTLPDVIDQNGLATLSANLSSVGLVGTLSGEGPFTVLAPSDDAFDELGETVDLSAVDSGVVENILLTHVVGGDLDAAAIQAAADVDSLAKTKLAVSGMSVGGATLSASLDILAANGRVHVLDNVIVPATLAETAATNADLSDLLTAVGRASLGDALTPDTLSGAMPITVFAPTNAAFTAANIDVGTVGTATLTAVLTNHVVEGQLTAADLTDGRRLLSLNGILTVSVDQGGAITITDSQGGTAQVDVSDVRTLNGVVHVIDAVLLP